MGSGLRFERLATFADLGEEWDRLAQASGNFFATREWLTTWWRHFGGDGELALTACRDGDARLVAILPLFVWRRRGLRVLRFVGHGRSDLLGPICARADVRAAQAALEETLADSTLRWHVFLGEQLLATEQWADALGAQVVRTTGFPVMRFEDGQTWDDVLAAKPGRWRAKLRRRERQLGDGRDVRYTLVDSTDGLEQALDDLFALHDERWRHLGQTSPFTGYGRPAFQRDVAEITAERGWLRLWFMEVDGVRVSARYGWRFGEAQHDYQAGRSRAWDRFAVGQLLIAHIVRAALEEGAREYRFLRGDEAYKYEFAQEDPRLDIVALGRTPLGSLALRAGIAAYRSPLRETLRRLTGA